jgi:hypothetical protein
MHIPASSKARFTVAVVVVLLHYATWRLGVFLLRHETSVEGFGSWLFFAAFGLRWYVVVGAFAYSVLQRFAMRKHEWDIYAPPLAVLSAALMWLEIQQYI